MYLYKCTYFNSFNDFFTPSWGSSTLGGMATVIFVSVDRRIGCSFSHMVSLCLSISV